MPFSKETIRDAAGHQLYHEKATNNEANREENVIEVKKNAKREQNETIAKEQLQLMRQAMGDVVRGKKPKVTLPSTIKDGEMAPGD